MKKTKTHEIKTQCGNVFLTEGEDFFSVKMGKNGDCQRCISGYIQDLITEIIKLDPQGWKQRLLESAKGHRCEKAVSRIENKGKSMNSCVDACYQAIKSELDNK